MIKRWVHRLLKIFGLRLIKTPDLEKLILGNALVQDATFRLAALEQINQSLELARTDAAALATALRSDNIALRSVNIKMLTELRAVQAENTQTKKSLRLRSEKKELLGKQNILLVVTASSQVNQIQLLLEETTFLTKYHPILVTYINSARAGLGDYCDTKNITLLDENLAPIVCRPEHRVNAYKWWENYRSEGLITDENRVPIWLSLGLDDKIDAQKLGDEVKFQNKLRNAFLRALNELAVVLLVMFEDNAETNTGIWIDAANIIGIPSIILPFTIVDSTEPAEAHLGDPLFHVSTTKYNELLSELHPHWVISYKGQNLVRRPGISALVAEWLGFAPPLPWILNSTYASAILVESEAMMEHYRKQGIEDSKLLKTGSLADDVLFKSRLLQITDDPALRSISTGKKVILCAFPPNQLTAGRPQLEFQEYAELVNFWMTSICSHPGWCVVVRPHPFMGDADVEMLKSHGAVVSLAHTATLIPMCDLYVASVSSTIRWAISMGKPVLNYDVFAYNYTDFDTVASVVKARSQQEFVETLRRLTSDSSYLSHLTSIAEEEASRWGEIDGKSGERIIRVFEGLVEGKIVRHRMF